MKKFPILIFIICLFSVSAFAQEAKLIDDFGRITCGDFSVRMDNLHNKFQNSQNSKIYVIYYGGRYRRESVWNKKTKSFDKLKLKYPHRNDGLNWAKSIPLFLSTYKWYAEEFRNTVNEKIVLINGGFRENIEVSIWIVQDNKNPPEPSPTIDEKDIKFTTNVSPTKENIRYGTPHYATCYDGL